MTTPKYLPQSAALAYRHRKSALQVLLVTSLDTERWVLPKGRVEAGLKPHESAAKEAFEEAGVKGQVESRSIGTYDYVKTELKGGGWCRVKVYPMAVTRVHRNWPEKNERARKWMRIEDAVQAVDEKKLKKLLAHFRKSWKSD